MKTQGRKLLAALLMVILLSAPLMAVEGDQVQYIGGTVKNIAPDSIGKLDLTNEKQMVFTAGQSTLVIPYAKIESYQYTQEVAHHLGALPTIAIVMVKFRQRRHYFRISFADENNVEQSVVLEVPKAMPKVVSAVLESRATTACNGARHGRCSAKPQE